MQEIWTSVRDLLYANLAPLIVRLIIIVLVLLVTRVAVSWASRATGRIFRRTEMAPEVEDLLASMVRFAVIAVGLVVVLSVLDLRQLAFSFVAGLGISGLVIGFALQDVTKNFAAGILLVFLRPFRLNDRIAMGNEEGMVTDIALRATTIRTDDGREVMIPNAMIYTGIIANLTRYSMRRSAVAFKLKGDTPLEEALATLRAVLQAQEHVQAQPAPDVLVTSIEAETISVEARYWLPARGIETAAAQSQIVRALRAKALEREWLA